MVPNDAGEGLLAALHCEVAAIDAGNPDAAVLLADVLIARALDARASDIHLHPLADGAVVRFRIDGRLHVAAHIPAALSPLLTTRLKVMAKLVVFQRSQPQDGRIEWKPESPGVRAPAGPPVTLRVAFLPTLHAEDVVVRLPESAARVFTLDALGMDDEALARVRSLLDLEQGTLLLTGPSSSGKTTTLYAMLRAIHEKRGNAAHILTLEDPIEQDLEFAGQVPIRSDLGLGWLAALRSVLRHDPNVILIGEIRDRETAEIAIQAGLTGHLVLSTVHSGRTVGVLIRLVHMGVEPFLVASSVTATLAQRLVRQVCPACKREAVPGPELARQLGVNEDERFLAAPGCATCSFTGSHGRVGLFEFLRVDARIREAIMVRSTEAVLQVMAFPRGDALLADALKKARGGRIGIEELARIAATGALEFSGAE